MNNYKHTQIGKFMIVIGLFVVMLVFFESFLEEDELTELILTGAFLITIFIVTLVLILFGSLTIVVNNVFIKISFGIGLIRKKWMLADIESVKIVKNKWWYGFGIRLTPYGWLYNVSGFDAVQIQLKKGRVFRIGTDQPHELQHAIIDQIAKIR